MIAFMKLSYFQILTPFVDDFDRLFHRLISNVISSYYTVGDFPKSSFGSRALSIIFDRVTVQNRPELYKMVQNGDPRKNNASALIRPPG